VSDDQKISELSEIYDECERCGYYFLKSQLDYNPQTDLGICSDCWAIVMQAYESAGYEPESEETESEV